jgi:hypothetical protein
MNSKWYIRCNLKTKTAENFQQIPETFLNISGMSDLSDEDLADLSWAGNPDYGFLTEEAAVAAKIKGIDYVKGVGNELRIQQIRQTRDALLYQSDALVLIDRWETYTPETKAKISEYRKALRDLTDNINPDNFTWPTLAP